MKTVDDFDGGDRAYWEERAREYGIRLPLWRLSTTAGNLRRWLKRIDMTVPQFLDDWGCMTLREACALLRDWPLRAVIGVLLETAPNKARERHTSASRPHHRILVP